MKSLTEINGQKILASVILLPHQVESKYGIIVEKPATEYLVETNTVTVSPHPQEDSWESRFEKWRNGTPKPTKEAELDDFKALLSTEIQAAEERGYERANKESYWDSVKRNEVLDEVLKALPEVLPLTENMNDAEKAGMIVGRYNLIKEVIDIIVSLKSQQIEK